MYIICLAFIGEILTSQFNQHSICILDKSGGLFMYLRPESRHHHNICSPHQRSFSPKKISYGLTVNIQSHLTTSRVRICFTCDFTLLALLWPRLLLVGPLPPIHATCSSTSASLLTTSLPHFKRLIWRSL